jgi:hypothetical protein
MLRPYVGKYFPILAKKRIIERLFADVNCLVDFAFGICGHPSARAHIDRGSGAGQDVFFPDGENPHP